MDGTIQKEDSFSEKKCLVSIGKVVFTGLNNSIGPSVYNIPTILMHQIRDNIL